MGLNDYGTVEERVLYRHRLGAAVLEEFRTTVLKILTTRFRYRRGNGDGWDRTRRYADLDVRHRIHAAQRVAGLVTTMRKCIRMEWF